MSKWKEIETYMAEINQLNEFQHIISFIGKDGLPAYYLDKIFKGSGPAHDAVRKLEKKTGSKQYSVMKYPPAKGKSEFDKKKRDFRKEEVKEDAPTNSNAAGGVDMNPTGLSKKKKELDARTKEYKIHARKLMAQREKRKLKAQKNLCGSFRKSVKENTDNFGMEKFIIEDNVAILRKIVKDKRNMPVKLKDGQMKVDLYTASAFVQTLDNKNIKPDTKKKLEFIINKGNKAQFLRTVDVIFK